MWFVVLAKTGHFISIHRDRMDAEYTWCQHTFGDDKSPCSIYNVTGNAIESAVRNAQLLQANT